MIDRCFSYNRRSLLWRENEIQYTKASQEGERADQVWNLFTCKHLYLLKPVISQSYPPSWQETINSIKKKKMPWEFPAHLVVRIWCFHWHQFSSVAQSCPTVCDPMDCSTPGFPVHQQLLKLAQTHVHWVGDAIQPSHPLSSPSPPAFNLSQHQGLFQWVDSLHEAAKVLEFQLQHQSFQWTPRTDLL